MDRVSGLDLMYERRRRSLTQWELSRLSNVPPYRISSAENDRVTLTEHEEERIRAALDSVPPERA